jgi:hypothetical protein
MLFSHVPLSSDLLAYQCSNAWPHYVEICNDVDSNHCMPMCYNQLPWRGIINSCQKKTFQYMMVKWWSQSSYIIVWKYKLIALFMNKNASCLIGGVWHWKCCCTCFKNSSLSRNQEQSFQNSLNKLNFFENNRNKTNGKVEHFIINNKGYLLHFNCQHLMFIHKNCKEEFLE